jgi:hypothetical protein
MNAVADSEAETIRAWLEAAIAQSGLKPTPFAKEAGLAPSTVLRALDRDHPSSLERRSIRKIMDTFHVAAPYVQDAQTTYGPGMHEAELVEIETAPAAFAGEPLTANQYVRRVNTRALDLAGFLPGDEVLLDMAVLPRAGDVVAAQVYNLQRGTAETVLRLYDPPYLVARSTDDTLPLKPLLVDNERVKVMAVAVRALRSRAR